MMVKPDLVDTFSFYQKMGMKVTQLIPSGYGPDIDRYDMEL